MKKYFIGIDVSKEKLDICLIKDDQIIAEAIVTNDTFAIKDNLQILLTENDLDKQAILICAEYTGQYTYPLSCICEELKIDLWLENPAQLKLNTDLVFKEEKMIKWMPEKLPFMLNAIETMFVYFHYLKNK